MWTLGLRHRALGKERDRGVWSVGHWGGAPGTEVVKFGWREREDRSYEEIGMGWGQIFRGAHKGPLGGPWETHNITTNDPNDEKSCQNNQNNKNGTI